MLNEAQIDKLLEKIHTFVQWLDPMLFDKHDKINFSKYQTDERLTEIPDSSLFTPINYGDCWNGKESYLWLKTTFTVPENLDGQDIFLMPHVGFYEALMFVNGQAKGTFATKIVYTGHGNHYCDLIKQNVKAGEEIEIALELYGGHPCPGTQPKDTFESSSIGNYNYTYNGAEICTKNAIINDFYFDLISVQELAEVLPKDSYMRANAVNALYEVHDKVYYLLNDTTSEDFYDGIKDAAPALKKVLSIKSSDEAPVVGLTGHSHMDTAWLWHVGETRKKVVRTYANALSLMDQYPEYRFVQSSALHSDFIREDCPELFKRIQEKVAEGRYEPNGGVWVECDCNVTSGESMIRQFLWGQRFTRKYFNYTSDCFWLPDTFGYSAAIPQIMKGCDVKYFLTTKIDWNDTNKFPYDSFWWEGLDGTRVLTHFNRTHLVPSVDDIYLVAHKQNKQKSVTNKRLLSYGYGDGGGGPEFEMIELARRTADLAEVGKTENTSVSRFMHELEDSLVNPNVYRGELYLELHRGTLTNQHTIKRNNRKLELALRNLEILTVSKAVKNSIVASSEDIAPIYKGLLVNQFHDILPGTCINRANTESRQQTTQLINETTDKIDSLLTSCEENTVTLTNTLSFKRTDPIFIRGISDGYILDTPCRQQEYTDTNGDRVLVVDGIEIDAFSSVTLGLMPGKCCEKCDISFTDTELDTDKYSVKFAENGTISSYFDKEASRELKGEGYNLNTFIMAEDVPANYDNWDVDADIEHKYKDVTNLVSREVISAGAVAVIIRSTYKISEKSTIAQDAFYFANRKEIRFDTYMNWHDNHRFLKAAFDTDLREDFVRNEIQFGFMKRPTTRNNSIEEAKFEVVNHKYTDLSETRYGVSILNDCKYGISANGGQLRLSLHKGGTHPDYKGEEDGRIHECTYIFSPHANSFSAESVVRPAYELNIPAICSKGASSIEQLIAVDRPNIIVEAIKPCEDNEKAYIVRLYECEGTKTNCHLDFIGDKLEETNMLEETKNELLGTENSGKLGTDLTFRAFEIKTIKVSY